MLFKIGLFQMCQNYQTTICNPCQFFKLKCHTIYYSSFKGLKKRRLDLFLFLAAAEGLRKRKIQHTDFGRYPGLRRNVLQPLFTRHRDTVDMCDNYIKRHFMLVCFILGQADWNITEFSPSRNCCSACWGSGNVLNLILEKIFHILGYIYMSMDVQCA